MEKSLEEKNEEIGQINKSIENFKFVLLKKDKEFQASKNKIDRQQSEIQEQKDVIQKLQKQQHYNSLNQEEIFDKNTKKLVKICKEKEKLEGKIDHLEKEMVTKDIGINKCKNFFHKILDQIQNQKKTLNQQDTLGLKQIFSKINNFQKGIKEIVQNKEDQIIYLKKQIKELNKKIPLTKTNIDFNPLNKIFQKYHQKFNSEKVTSSIKDNYQFQQQNQMQIRIQKQEKEIIDLYKKLNQLHFTKKEIPQEDKKIHLYQNVYEELQSLFQQVEKFKEEKEKFVEKYEIQKFNKEKLSKEKKHLEKFLEEILFSNEKIKDTLHQKEIVEENLKEEVIKLKAKYKYEIKVKKLLFKKMQKNFNKLNARIEILGKINFKRISVKTEQLREVLRVMISQKNKDKSLNSNLQKQLKKMEKFNKFQKNIYKANLQILENHFKTILEQLHTDKDVDFAKIFEQKLESVNKNNEQISQEKEIKKLKDKFQMSKQNFKSQINKMREELIEPIFIIKEDLEKRNQVTKNQLNSIDNLCLLIKNNWFIEQKTYLYHSKCKTCELEFKCEKEFDKFTQLQNNQQQFFIKNHEQKGLEEKTTLEEIITVQEKTIKSLKKEIDQQQMRMKEYQQKILASVEEKQNQLLINERMSLKIEKYQREIRRKNDLIEKLQKQQVESNQKFNENASASQQCENLAQKNQKNEIQIRYMKEQVENLNMKVKELETQLEMKQDEINKHQKEIKSVKNNLLIKKEEIKPVQMNIDEVFVQELEKSKENLHKKYRSLQKDFQIKVNHLRDLQVVVGKLENQLIQKKNELENSKKQNEQQIKKIIQLQNKTSIDKETIQYTQDIINLILKHLNLYLEEDLNKTVEKDNFIEDTITMLDLNETQFLNFVKTKPKQEIPKITSENSVEILELILGKIDRLVGRQFLIKQLM